MQDELAFKIHHFMSWTTKRSNPNISNATGRVLLFPNTFPYIDFSSSRNKESCFFYSVLRVFSQPLLFVVLSRLAST